jgi:hypothetical protein
VRLVGQHQALHELAADDVLLDDLLDVGLGDVAVPDLLGVDDHRHAVLALVEAARVVGAHDLAEATLAERHLEGVADLHAALALAAAARRVGRALVDADEDMTGKARHRCRGYRRPSTELEHGVEIERVGLAGVGLTRVDIVLARVGAGVDAGEAAVRRHRGSLRRRVRKLAEQRVAGLRTPGGDHTDAHPSRQAAHRPRLSSLVRGR